MPTYILYIPLLSVTATDACIIGEHIHSQQNVISCLVETM